MTTPITAMVPLWVCVNAIPNDKSSETTAFALVTSVDTKSGTVRLRVFLDNQPPETRSNVKLLREASRNRVDPKDLTVAWTIVG